VKVTDEVLGILGRSTTDGPRLHLPEQLERDVYRRVNQAITAAGGKWNRGAGAHLFDGVDAADAIESLMLTGEITTPQEVGWFPTPEPVVAKLIAAADGIFPRMNVLEPSAGTGAIASRMADLGAAVDCVELDGKRARALAECGRYRFVGAGDFLDITPTPFYARVVMNPPFAARADVRHVSHALEFLAPGGRLVSVMALGVEFRQDKLTTGFRDLVAGRGGEFERLPDAAFKESGTMISTVMVTIPN
jgi:predicted RNA methylase